MDETVVLDAPGGWALLRAGERAVAVPASVGLERLAEALVGPIAGTSPLLDLMLAGGVEAAPPFALLAADAEGVRVLVRGAARVESPDVVVTGDAVTTWTERMLPAGELSIVVPGARWTFRLGVVAATPAAPTPPSASSTPAPLSPPEAPPAADAPAAADPAPVEADPAPAPAPPVPPLIEPPAAVPLTGADAESTLVPGDPADDDRPIHEFLFGPGDHDGATVLAPVGVGSGADAPTVALPAEPRLVLELPDGRREPLDGALVVGRAPTAGPSGGVLPRLVAIAVDDPDISRSHARIAVEGGTAVVTDLGSRNGTVVRIPGHPPRRLRDGEPTAVLAGTVIDFGGGVAATVLEG